MQIFKIFDFEPNFNIFEIQIESYLSEKFKPKYLDLKIELNQNQIFNKNFKSKSKYLKFYPLLITYLMRF